MLVIVPSLMNHRLGNIKELRRCVFWLDLDCRNDGHQWIYCSSMSTFFLVFYIFSNWWHLLDGLNFSLLYRSLWSVLRRQYKDTHNNKSRFSFFLKKKRNTICVRTVNSKSWNATLFLVLLQVGDGFRLFSNKIELTYHRESIAFVCVHSRSRNVNRNLMQPVIYHEYSPWIDSIPNGNVVII
jgi:hypothetical protein